MFSKKGAWVGFVLHPVFETLIAIIVLVALMYQINGLDEKASFEKRFISTDLALLLDTIPAMPQHGNLIVFYNPQRNDKFGIKYGFKFEKNAVSVATKANDLQPGVYYTIPDPAISLQEAEFPYSGNVIYPVITKEGKKIIVDDINKKSWSYSKNVLACGGTRVSGSIIASPAHQTGPEKQAEENIASYLKGATSGSGNEIPVALRIGSSPPDRIMIKAYINGEKDRPQQDESQRLACEMVNALLLYWGQKGVEVAGAAVVPVNPEHTAAKDDDMLVKGKTGVLLDFGTMQVSGLVDFLDAQIGVASELARGVANAQS
jgi:hypothetical protein